MPRDNDLLEEEVSPAGWTLAPIGRLCTLINGRAFKPTDWTQSGLPIIRIQNLNNPKASFNHYDGKVDDRHLVKRGDLLFAWSGTPGTSFGAHVWEGDDAVLNQHIFRVIFNADLVDRDFFRLAINHRLEELIAQAHGGAGLAHITKGRFEATEVLVPPLAEQRRIMAHIEVLFGAIRDARKDLDRTLILAERLRKRVLASAFENEDGWLAQPLGSVITRVEAGKSIRCDERQPRPGERGIIKISAVTWGTFDAKEIKTAPRTADLNTTTRIQNGDFLISRANTLELVGAPVIAEGVPPETYLSDKVLRLSFAEDIAEWVLWYLRSPQGRQEIESRSSGNQLSMRNIGQTALKEIPLPLPEPDDRRRILAHIKASHAESHTAEHDARRGLALLEQLERAILDTAFRGDLVPQDAADEPAEETLARLWQEVEAPTRPRGQQRRRAA